MYFFIDSADRSMVAFASMGAAARAALQKLEVECPKGTDPVQLAHNELDDRGVLLNLSAAFEAIANSDDTAAQELAQQFHQAVNDYYER